MNFDNKPLFLSDVKLCSGSNSLTSIGKTCSYSSSPTSIVENSVFKSSGERKAIESVSARQLSTKSRVLMNDVEAVQLSTISRVTFGESFKPSHTPHIVLPTAKTSSCDSFDTMGEYIRFPVNTLSNSEGGSFRMGHKAPHFVRIETSKSSDGRFDSSTTPSSYKLTVTIPSAFDRQYKISSILSEKNIKSFAFRGHEFCQSGAANSASKNSMDMKLNKKGESTVVIYKGYDHSKKFVIIERTRAGVLQNSTLLIEYFERLDLMRQINHISIPQVRDVYDTPHDYTIVLQYSVGKSLHDLLESRGSMRDNKKAMQALVLALIDTIQYLHNMNVAHRNIATSHLIVSKFKHFRRPKSLRVNGLSRMTSVQSSGVSFTNTAAVPEQYINVFSAPELSRPNHGLEVDLYSLGVVIYSILKGKTPSDKNDIYVDKLPVSLSLKCIITSLVHDNPSNRCTLLNLKNYFSKTFMSEDSGFLDQCDSVESSSAD